MAQIAGEETRSATAQMIDAVLEHKRTLRVEYRCDSPSMARKFLMTVQPMKDGRALMVHDLRDAWHFAPPLNRWCYDPTALDTKCSFCGSVRFDGETDWTRCDDIGDRHPSHVTYEICQSCRESVDHALDKVRNGTEADMPVDDQSPASLDDQPSGPATGICQSE
jgi:hypothetical protein